MSGISKRDFEKLEHKVATHEGILTQVRDTLNKTREGVASIAGGVAQNLAGVKANLDANGDALEQFDIFNQIWAKLFMRLAQRLTQTDYMLENNLDPEELTENDLSVIKEKAKEWFDATFIAMKAEVQEEREAYIKELRAKAAEIQKAQEEAAKEEERAKKEEKVAEDTLRGAEQNLSTLGGQGSDIPEGAEIFGG